jgi:hypothetical protein
MRCINLTHQEFCHDIAALRQFFRAGSWGDPHRLGSDIRSSEPAECNGPLAAMAIVVAHEIGLPKNVVKVGLGALRIGGRQDAALRMKSLK